MLMLVIQSQDTFIRTTPLLGYITNQKTKLERLYNETGVDYLNKLARSAKDIETIVRDELLPMYADVEFNIVFQDFNVFLQGLEENGFVFLGETQEELTAKSQAFYSQLSKRKSDDFLQSLSEEVKDSTQEAMLDMINEHPHLMSLQFELTSKCNERCIHCYIPNEKKDHGIDMPLPLFKKIIDQFYEMGGLQVSLSGGEIFMHKDIIEIIQYCRLKDMQITLLSNLLSLNSEHIEVIKAANVAMVQASLYSMDEERHDSITKVKGSYVKTRQAIESLVKADIPVMISCPMMKINAYDYRDILNYAHSLGIKAQTDFILMAEENLSTEILKNRISLAETEIVIREILKNAGVDSADTISGTLQPNKVKIKENQPICAAGVSNLCINANGDIYPCNGWQGFKAGNMHKATLSDIWNTSEALKELRQITRQSFKKCNTCDVKDYCSICMARNYNESNGDPLKINPHFCEIARLNKRIHEELSQP